MKRAGDDTLTIPHRMMALFKKAAEPLPNEDVVDEVLKAYHGLSEETKDQIRLALRALLASQVELEQTAMVDMARQLASAAGYTDPTMIAAPPLAAAKEETPPLDPPTAEKQGADMSEQANLDAVAKAASDQLEEVRKAHVAEMETLRKSHDALAMKLAAAEQAQKRGEFITKARGSMSKVAKAEDLGDLMVTISEKCGDEVMAKLTAILEQANVMIEQGSVLKEIGSGQDSEGGDSYAQLETLAKAHAAQHNLTPAVAMAHVMKTPEGKRLYNEYTAARR